MIITSWGRKCFITFQYRLIGNFFLWISSCLRFYINTWLVMKTFGNSFLFSFNRPFRTFNFTTTWTSPFEIMHWWKYNTSLSDFGACRLFITSGAALFTGLLLICKWTWLFLVVTQTLLNWLELLFAFELEQLLQEGLSKIFIGYGPHLIKPKPKIIPSSGYFMGECTFRNVMQNGF